MHFLHAKTTLGHPCLLLANPSPISYTIRENLITPNLCPTNMQVGKWHHFRILGSGGILLAVQSMVLSSYHPKSSKINIISLTLKKSLNFPSRNCCDSRKILSQNFLFLELRSPGKFCPGKKIVLEFSKYNSTKNVHSRNLQSWNFPFLEFIFVLELSVPGILFHGIYLLPNFHYRSSKTLMQLRMQTP